MLSASALESDMAELELALLRRGIDERVGGQESCAGCSRTPLVGERVHLYQDGRLRCELCRARARELPLQSRIVHTPAAGHTIRVLDQRAV